MTAKALRCFVGIVEREFLASCASAAASSLPWCARWSGW